MKIQITNSLARNTILSSLFVLFFGSGCNDKSPAPVPVPTKFGSLIGNDQEAPARATLPNPILLIFTEAKGIENTDMVLLDFTIIKGNGKASKTKDTVELAKNLRFCVKSK